MKDLKFNNFCWETIKKPVGQNPRFLELVNIAKQRQRTPQEEAEYRGLMANPDNPEAAKLVEKEYLAECGLVEFTEDDKERLRSIREEIFKNRKSLNDLLSREDSDDSLSPKKDKTIDGNYIFDIVFAKAKQKAALENWKNAPPLEFINNALSQIPEKHKVYDKGEKSLMPTTDEPSSLELYFLSKVDSLPPEFEDVKGAGSLRVIESTICLRDVIRTKKFLLGIKSAIRELEKKKEKINLCDAGCGAIPILSIYAALCSEKVHCTSLELNYQSAQIARKIIEALGLQDRINIIETDVTQFQPQNKIDSLVSETMHTGLTEEPIVDILSNLSKYVEDDGIKLPSKINILAGFVPGKDYLQPDKYIRILGENNPHVPVDWKVVSSYKPGDNLQEIEFALDSSHLLTDVYYVLVNTEVDIFGQKLTSYQSLITNPAPIETKDGGNFFATVIREKAQFPKIHVRYKPGSNLKGVAKKE